MTNTKGCLKHLYGRRGVHIVDMLLTVQHHLPCISRYSTMPLPVTIFKFLNVINLFQCDASDILKQILTFAK
jgi:hypothetical protein